MRPAYVFARILLLLLVVAGYSASASAAPPPPARVQIRCVLQRVRIADVDALGINFNLMPAPPAKPASAPRWALIGDSPQSATM